MTGMAKNGGGARCLNVEVKPPAAITIQEKKDCCFLVCIGAISLLNDRELFQNEFMKEIDMQDITDFVILDRTLSISALFESCLKENNIDLQGEILDLQGVKIPNFLRDEDEKVKKTFLAECADLLLPYFFDEYREVDEGPYEEHSFRISQGDVVFDCGANLGLFSAIAAHRADRVFAFEPIPNSIHLLQRTRQLYDNIVICDSAVSDLNGFVEMVNEENLGQNRMVRSEMDLKEILVKVPCLTLDEFVRKNDIGKVDFIKADIEGAERRLLRGAKMILREFAPKLALCTYHLDDDPVVLESLIKKANPAYVVRHKYKKLYAYVK